jgi:hypothetical protein
VTRLVKTVMEGGRDTLFQLYAKGCGARGGAFHIGVVRGSAGLLWSEY